MCEWKIEYMQGMSIGRFKTVEADTIRMGVLIGDMWFCDEKDRTPTGDYTPKFILAKGTYLSVERIDEVEKTEFEKDFKQKDKIDWI